MHRPTVITRRLLTALALASVIYAAPPDHAVVQAATSVTPPRLGTAACTANSVGSSVSLIRQDRADGEMQARIAKNPELGAALAKSAAQFTAAGFTATGRWTVLHVSEPGVRSVQNGQVWDQDLVIAWYSYDNGDHSTWTGTVYLGNGAGEEGTWDQETDLTTRATLMQPHWSYNTYFSGGGRRGPFHRGASQFDLRDQFHLAPVQRATNRPLYRSPNWQGFYGCSTARCAGAAVGCMLFAGPSAPGCFAGGCTASIVSCTYGNLWG